MGRHVPLIVLAALLALPGCSQEPDMTLDEAETLLAETTRAVFDQVAPNGRVDMGTERWPCQNDLGQDSGEMRAELLSASGVVSEALEGASESDVQQQIARVLENHGFHVEPPDEFGIDGTHGEVRVGFHFRADVGRIAASGTTACH